MTLKLEAKHHLNGVIIRVSGDIDTLTAPQLQACLNGELREGPQVFVIDMGEVRYISSMGLRVFLSHLKRLKSQNGSIIIAAAGKLVSDVFKMSGFSKYFEMTADLNSCLDKLDCLLPIDEGEVDPSRS